MTYQQVAKDKLDAALLELHRSVWFAGFEAGLRIAAQVAGFMAILPASKRYVEYHRQAMALIAEERAKARMR